MLLIITGRMQAPSPWGDLEEVLRRAATKERTVIMTQINAAWTRPGSLLDLYLESFKNGEDIAHLVNHVLVVALDTLGFERCKAVHPHCYLLRVQATTTANMSSAKGFMSRDYLELVWTKLTFQQRVLELGYNFLFTARTIIPPNTFSLHFFINESEEQSMDGRSIRTATWCGFATRSGTSPCTPT